MMTIICCMILFLLSVWLLVSLFICCYWFFHPGDLFWTEHKYISITIGIGALLACVAIVSIGVEPFLWFIPKNWVYEKEGELRLVRYSVATLIGIIVAFFWGALFDKVCKMRRKNEHLGTELDITREIARRKNEYGLLENDELEVAIKGVRLELTVFEELAIADKITPSQEIEQRVLVGLLEELEKRMKYET